MKVPTPHGRIFWAQQTAGALRSHHSYLFVNKTVEDGNQQALQHKTDFQQHSPATQLPPAPKQEQRGGSDFSCQGP